VDYDWKELEPSLPNNHQGYFVDQKPIIETSFDSTQKLIIPNFAQLQSIGIHKLQNDIFH
jgi:hypothetical protein